MAGASTAGRMTLATRLCHLTAWAPAAASIAPITPPISACDELDGIPKNQVSRFHTIAPVAIVVAIALPVSWNPLVKSKARAVTTTRPSTTSLPTSSESRPANSVSILRKQRPTDIRLPFDFRSPSGHLIDGWWQPDSRPPVQKQQREQQQQQPTADSSDRRRRITLARSTPAGDMSGLK